MIDKYVNKIIQGDCLEVMKELPENSIDTIITDPPYGIGFMGKEWDTFDKSYLEKRRTADKKRKPRTDGRKVAAWGNAADSGSYDYSRNAEFQRWFTGWGKEALRVLKPGGTMLIFGGTRTYHRLACGLEDAGWILKDCIMWLYGSGFPKATDISKQIDKKPNVHLAGQMRDKLNEYRLKKGLSVKQVNEHFGFATTGSGVAHHWMTHPTQPTVPTEKQYRKLKKLFEIDNKKLDKLYVEAEREITGKDKNWGKKGNVPLSGYKEFDITKASTSEAKLWNGWKSHGLKPAYEPIIVAMKPNEGSYANNALKWEVAGLNINGGRIGTREKAQVQGEYKGSGVEIVAQRKSGKKYPKEQGRFPSNIIIDEDVAKILDRQNGDVPRFFYIAKTSKAERNRGCEELEEKKVSDGRQKEADNAYQRGKTLRSNTHPTVKPLKLMKYLCMLTKTPTGGIVLDPFGGSCTTALACLKTGRDFIMIEREKEYVGIGKARIEQERNQLKLFT